MFLSNFIYWVCISVISIMLIIDIIYLGRKDIAEDYSKDSINYKNEMKKVIWILFLTLIVIIERKEKITP